MTRPGSEHSAAAVEHSGSVRSRRRHRGAPGDPIRVTTMPAATPVASDINARIAGALNTSAGRAALLPLESAGCDGRCAVPAVYDRATGSWRHLTDLKHCQRPGAAPTGSGVRQ